MGDVWAKLLLDKKSYKSSKGTNPGIRKEEEDKGRLCEVC